MIYLAYLSQFSLVVFLPPLNVAKTRQPQQQQLNLEIGRTGGEEFSSARGRDGLGGDDFTLFASVFYLRVEHVSSVNYCHCLRFALSSLYFSLLISVRICDVRQRICD